MKDKKSQEKQGEALVQEETGDKKSKAIAVGGTSKSSSKAIGGSKDDLFGREEGKGRKRTEEGYRIYTEEELGLNKKGGDTDLCPFDCDCCY